MASNKIELTRATSHMLHSLRSICVDAYSKNFYHHWNDGGLEWYIQREFGLARLAADLENDDVEYYIVEVDEKPAGFAKIKDCTNLPDQPPAEGMELEKIYILPDFKGMGLGGYALRRMLERAAEKERKIFFLCVIDTNQQAIAFYERAGFKFHSKTRLDIPFFKEELKGMNRMFIKV